MSVAWIDIKGSILADTVYVDNKLVAKDVEFTLPSITPLTNEFKAMGTLTLPVMGQFESMEFSITKVGIDLGLLSLCLFKSQNYEFRFVQDSLGNDGNQTPEGCKAFIRGIPLAIPGIGASVGSASENEATGTATRYELIVGGTQYWIIDRLNNICKINGVDYVGTLYSML